jgi:hypothetical protein
MFSIRSILCAYAGRSKSRGTARYADGSADSSVAGLLIRASLRASDRALAIRPTVLFGTPRASSAMGPTGIWDVLPRNPCWKAAGKSFRRISRLAPANALSIRASTSFRGRVLSNAANTAVKRAPNAPVSCICAQLAQIRSRRTTPTPWGIFVGRAREPMSAITVGLKVHPDSVRACKKFCRS